MQFLGDLSKQFLHILIAQLLGYLVLSLGHLFKQEHLTSAVY